MITNEMKAKVFGLYIGCPMTGSDIHRTVTGNIIDLIQYGQFPYQLILKPISEITDQDAIELCRLYYPMAFEGRCPPSKWEVKRDFIANCHYISIGCSGNANSFNIDLQGLCIERYDEGELCESGYMIPAIDFLRSKSYMLPYMGIDLFESSLAIPKQ